MTSYSKIPLYFIVLSFLYYSSCGGISSWDGSLYLSQILSTGYFIPHNRFSVLIFQFPVLLLSKYIDNINLLEFSYGITYTLIPASLSFLICFSKELTPRGKFLFLSSLLLPTIPLIFQQLNEVLLVYELNIFWLYLFLTSSKYPSPSRAYCKLFIQIASITFIFFLHPIAFVSFIFFSFVYFIEYIRKKSKTYLGLFLIASALSIARYLLTFILLSDIERTELSPNIWIQHFYSGVLGWPFFIIFLAYLIFIADFLLYPLKNLRKLNFLITVITLLLLLTSVILWSSKPQNWGTEIDYRKYLLILGLPFMFILWIRASSFIHPPIYRAADIWSKIYENFTIIVSIIFFLTLSLQSFQYHNLRKSVSKVLTESQSLVLRDLEVLFITKNTALHGWHISYNALLLQGKEIKKLIFTDQTSIDHFEKNQLELFKLAPSINVKNSNWFNFQPFISELATNVIWQTNFQNSQIEKFEDKMLIWKQGDAKLQIFAGKFGPKFVSAYGTAPFSSKCLNTKIIFNALIEERKLCGIGTLSNPTLILNKVPIASGNLTTIAIDSDANIGSFANDPRPISLGLLLPPTFTTDKTLSH